MNKYGALAMRHWKTYDPDRYASLQDPEAFFTELGELAETQIQSLEADLAGSDPPGEEYLAKLGRLRMARASAEEQVLSELILIPSALPEDQEPPEDPHNEPEVGTAAWMLWNQRQQTQASAQDLEEEIDSEMRSDPSPSPPPHPTSNDDPGR